MSTPARQIPGYSYGTAEVAVSPVTPQEFTDLKTTVGFTDDDTHYLQLAGPILADQTQQIVDYWRADIIAAIPNLARHSRTPQGDPIPAYLAASGQRFRQWILDTCLKPYDRDWLNYQHEIALRHTTAKKNQVDGVRSTPYVPLRDIIAFVAVMNETIKPFLAAKGNPPDEVEKMHRAWCKSIQLQIALWTRTFMDANGTSGEW